MKKSAIFPIVLALLFAVSIIHKIRKGVDDRASASSSASVSEPVRQPASAAPATATVAAPVGAAPAAASASGSKMNQSFDAALERIRNDPKLSLLERRQRETELSGIRAQMMRSEAALSRLKKPQAEQAAASATASGSPAPPAPPAAATAPASDLPYGIPIPGRPGFINSPFAAKHQVVDVTGQPAGSEVKCPYTGKLFRLP